MNIASKHCSPESEQKSPLPLAAFSLCAAFSGCALCPQRLRMQSETLLGGARAIGHIKAQESGVSFAVLAPGFPRLTHSLRACGRSVPRHCRKHPPAYARAGAPPVVCQMFRIRWWLQWSIVLSIWKYTLLEAGAP